MIHYFYNFLWPVAYALLFPCNFLGKKVYYARKFALDLPERARGEKRIDNPDKSEKMGNNARSCVHLNSGAAGRIMDFIGGDIASS